MATEISDDEEPTACPRCGRATCDGGCALLEDGPEPREACLSTCHYCGSTFDANGDPTADDCGACPLTGEDLDAYARDRCAVAVVR